MGLAEALVHIPQSERGGEIAQRGFDYQSCWALSEMLEYELNGKSYVFIFEYHDDILILDNTISPKDLTFAQVKTNESHWTASSLSKSTSKKPISIIGKLFIHYKDFIEYSPQLLFVTNAALKLCDCNGGKSFFGAHEVKKEHQDKFKQAIKDQAKLDDSCIDLSVMRFIQSSLSLEDHITHLKGKLCNFISKKYGDSSTLNINALASLLDQECRSKSKIKSADIINFSDLIAKKGFSSQDLNNVLDSLNTSNKNLPTWEMAKPVFHDLGKSALQIIKLQATFLQVCIEINQEIKNPSRIYQKVAIELYDEQKIHLNLNEYVIATIDKIDACCPDYELALTACKKECIIIYSIIQMLLKGDDK